ncbi:MAG TPA: hypothetical protein VGM64_14235 [Lacunisphaera sp.]|jgi:hypothetical protein
MNKAYLIFPLIGLLVFGGFYINFDKGYEAKELAIKVKADNEKKAKALQQVADREAAIKAAVEAQAIRKKEREEKERADEAKKLAKQQAEDYRQKTFDDRNKFRDQVARLKRELAEVKETTAKIAEDKKSEVKEEEFLKNYVKLAEANVKYYYTLLDKISAAEKAAADAAAAAAASQSKKG